MLSSGISSRIDSVQVVLSKEVCDSAYRPVHGMRVSRRHVMCDSTNTLSFFFFSRALYPEGHEEDAGYKQDLNRQELHCIKLLPCIEPP